MTTVLTSEQSWLSRRYLQYRFLKELWFISAVWLYFYRIYITDQQVGILEGMAFTIGLVAEVPSGALADKFGRGRMVRIGQTLAGTGLIIQAFGSSFAPFFVGQSIVMIGIAFSSGADEALFFERTGFDDESSEWRKLITRGSQLALAGATSATVIGGGLHLLNPRIPWFATGISFIGTVSLIWNISDSRPPSARGSFTAEVKSYLTNIREGFGAFSQPKLKPYVFYILAVQGLFYSAGYGLLRIVLLDRFGYSEFWGAVLVAACALVTILILHSMAKKADQLSEKLVFTVVGLAAVSSLIVSVFPIGAAIGSLVIFALYAAGHALPPVISEALNHRTDDSKRATVLSVASFLKALPYAVLAPLIGYLSTNDQLEAMFVVWALIIIASVGFYLKSYRPISRV